METDLREEGGEALIGFVSAMAESKGRREALQTQVRKMCICIFTISMYCSVSSIATVSEREEGNKQRDSTSWLTSPPNRAGT